MRPLFKQIIVSLLLLSTTALSLYWLSVLLFSDAPFLSYFIFFLISFFFCATFFVFFALSSVKFWGQVLVYFLASFLIILFFKIDSFTALSALCFFLFLVLGSRAIKVESALFLKFKFFRLAQKGFESFFTGFAILIGALLFLSPKVIGGELTLPRSLFDAFWPTVENIFSKQFPGFSGDGTVDDFILLQVPEVSEEDILNQNLSPFQDEKIVIDIQKELEKEIQKKIEDDKENMLQQGRDQFSQMLGREVKGDEKIKDVFYEIASSQISKRVGPYEKFGIIGIIFIFFLIIKMLFMWLIYFLLPFSYFLFIIFKKIKFFAIRIEKVDKEVLTI